MSVHAVSWVLKNSLAELGNRLVLIVLADHADKDGRNSFPTIQSIADEARLSKRQTQRNLQSLWDAGFIQLVGKTTNGVKIWDLTMGDNMSPRQNVTLRRDKMSSPKVSQMSPPSVVNVTPSNNKDLTILLNHPIKVAFAPPTIEEIVIEGKELGMEPSVCEDFRDYFENCDWKLSGGRGARMKDWRLALKRWNRNQPGFSRNPKNLQSAPKLEAREKWSAEDRRRSLGVPE